MYSSDILLLEDAPPNVSVQDGCKPELKEKVKYPLLCDLSIS